MVRFQNTLTGILEDFTPLADNTVRMYACGPTVYNFAHIGNFRTFIFVDVLRRYLKYRGFDVVHVMNLTDIDDKIIIKAHETGQDIRTFTEVYIKHFLDDLKTLDIQMPEHLIRATDHIPEMTALVERLLANGHAYASDGSVYYRIASFADYGKLSHINLEGNIAGARVDVDEYEKNDARDFVLWKESRPNEPSWDTPFGAGRPGWHLECSAMAMKYLGESFDIHCGGVDLVFPHHENEIAQSEAATGKPFARYWLHAEHLQVDGEKMSKSKKNDYTLEDLKERGFSPRAIRYTLLAVPYRKPLNFTFEGLQGNERRLERLADFRLRLHEARTVAEEAGDTSREIVRARESFEAGMDDDLNTAQGLAALTILETALNRAMGEGRLTEADKQAGIALLEDINGVFGLFDTEVVREMPDADVQALIDERLAARKARNFARSDDIRNLLAERGIILEDTRDGTRWKRK